MQGTPEKVRREELQLTKVILGAPSEETSDREACNEPFIYYPRSAGGRALVATHRIAIMSSPKRGTYMRQSTIP